MTQRFTVTVFTQPDCQPCRATKKALDDAGVIYGEVSLAENEQASYYVQHHLGHRQAPVVVVTEEVDHWSGFRPAKVKELKEQIGDA